MKRVNDKNRLTIRFPEIAKEWDYDNNGALTPENVSYGSSQKVYWKCGRCHHNWESEIRKRTLIDQNRQCSFCNSLGFKFPSLVGEWHPAKNGLKTPFDIGYGSKKVFWWRCKDCNHEWESPVSRRSCGKSECPKCSREKGSKKRIEKASSQFIKKARLIHGDKYDYDKSNYINGRKKMCIICKKHGEWWQTPNNHLTGFGCKKCGNETSPEEVDKYRKRFIENSEILHGKKYDYSKFKYVDSVTKGVIVCPTHGEFLQIPGNHMGGWGCPKCSSKYKKIELKDGAVCDSLPEAYVYLKLKSRGFEIEQRKRYGFRKYVCDFYIPKLNTYIEVTSFHKDALGFGGIVWPIYYKKILVKKEYTEKTLCSKFRFIQIKMNRFRVLSVKNNMK